MQPNTQNMNTWLDILNSKILESLNCPFEISARGWVADCFSELLKLLRIGMKDRKSISQMASVKALKCSERIFYARDTKVWIDTDEM
ncbi:hypothetical protein RCL1_000940 [Eukaryota sp. TZLM3-RCL]